MTWIELPFGKYTGLTLPQVLFTDPGWFFWANQAGALLRQGVYGGEDLARKACRIRIPGAQGGALVVEYAFHPGGGLAVVQLAPVNAVREAGGSTSFTRTYIDLSIPSQLAPRDKAGGRVMVDFLKVTYFGSTSYRMTRDRCEEFFDDPSHFLP